MKRLIIALLFCVAVVDVVAAKSDDKNSDGWSEFDYSYYDGTVFYSCGRGYIWYEEYSSQDVKYGICCDVNIRTAIETVGGSKFNIADEIVIRFPTRKSRKLWESALNSACEKMLDWLDTAKRNNVERLEKELPESAFKDGLPLAMIDWLDSDANRMKNECMLFCQSVGENEFAKKSVKLRFQCSFEKLSGDEYRVGLSLGRNEAFPCGVFFAVGTVEEIRSCAQKFLIHANSDSFARALKSQRKRNSIFSDGIDKGNVANRLKLPKEKMSVYLSPTVNKDSCWSDWSSCCWGGPINMGHRLCAAFKGVGNEWNYALVLGDGGIPRARRYWYGNYYWADFEFYWHLLSFPTEALRRQWYAVIKGSCGRVLEWIELASKKDVPVVTKTIYDSTRDGGKLLAYYDLITKGNGQKELLHKTLKANAGHLGGVALPVAVTGRVMVMEDKESKDKNFSVVIRLRCGNVCDIEIFKESGTYERIQHSLVEFLNEIDPESLIGAWNEKYGKGDLFE